MQGNHMDRSFSIDHGGHRNMVVQNSRQENIQTCLLRRTQHVAGTSNPESADH